MLSEVRFSLKADVLKRGILILILALCISLADISYNDYTRFHMEIAPLKLSDRIFYQVGEILHGSLEHEFFSRPEALERLKEYIVSLEENTDYPYYIVSSQSVHRSGMKLPKEFYKGFQRHAGDEEYDQNPSPMYEAAYEKGDLGLASFQVNQAVLRDFPLSLLTGRMLSGEDFMYDENKPIPVLLGSSYIEYTHLSNRFQGYFMTQPHEFEVIGFIDAGQFLPFEDFPTYLDNVIIMPSLTFNHTPANDRDLFFQQAVYLDKSTGFLGISEAKTFQTLVLYMEALTQSYGLFEPVFYRVDNQVVRMMKLSGSNRIMLTKALTWMAAMLSFFLFMTFEMMATIKQLRRYGILMLNGYSRRDLMRLLLTEITLTYLTTAILSYFLEIGALSQPTGRHTLVALIGYAFILLSSIPAFIVLLRFNGLSSIKEINE